MNMRKKSDANGNYFVPNQTCEVFASSLPNEINLQMMMNEI